MACSLLSPPLTLFKCVYSEKGKFSFSILHVIYSYDDGHNAQTIYIPDYIGCLPFVSNFCTEHWDCGNSMYYAKVVHLPCT